jgi:hypothetical protein
MNYITQGLRDTGKMENNLRVVGEMRVGVELGNKRVCGNRKTPTQGMKKG